MTCPITGDAIIQDRDGEPRWLKTDPEIHVAQELLDNADGRGRAFLTTTYELGEQCPDQPNTRHARLRVTPAGMCPGCPCGWNGSHPADPEQRTQEILALMRAHATPHPAVEGTG